MFRKLFPEITVDTSGEATKLVRSGLLLGVLFFLGFLSWGLTAPISGAIIANGIIKIDSNRKTLQHLEGGIIKEILVHEGSVVKKNQPVLVLENINTSSQLTILNDRYLSVKAKLARLMAQKRQAANMDFPQELLNSANQAVRKQLQTEIALFNSKRKSLLDQIDLLKHEISETEQQIQGLSGSVDAIKTNIELITKQLTAISTLQKSGFTEESKLWEQQRVLAEKKERLGVQQSEISLAKSKITETNLRIIALENAYIQEADDQLKETEKELTEIQQLLRPAKNADERTIIEAPLDGQVINLKVSTIGGIVSSGQVLMDIVPQQNQLIVEAKINTTDIDSVHMEQNAKLQLLAYSSRKTPLVDGKLIYISGDALIDSVNPSQYFYLCHIQISADSLATLPKHIVLFPGMPVVAFIQTRTRTFIDFVLEPIIDNMRRTLRED